MLQLNVGSLTILVPLFLNCFNFCVEIWQTWMFFQSQIQVCHSIYPISILLCFVQIYYSYFSYIHSTNVPKSMPYPLKLVKNWFQVISYHLIVNTNQITDNNIVIKI